MLDLGHLGQFIHTACVLTDVEAQQLRPSGQIPPPTANTSGHELHMRYTNRGKVIYIS